MSGAKEMLSSLLRPRKIERQRLESTMFDSNRNTPSPGPANRQYQEPRRHATADFTENDDDDDEESNEESNEGDEEEEDEQVGTLPRFTRYHHNDGHQDTDGRRGSASMLPLFSSSYLDSLPVYSIVHAIRIIVQTRTETTLSWDQLRSPQVSQFLVKPMQQQIRTQHFTRATLYALMANCLQFTKEGQLYPGNAGTSSTRAKVCELLALKLLKEYSTRELIDALSYDFYPLQGSPEIPITPSSRNMDGRVRPGAARSSTLEVAILASAKHFLAHPLVVQQLEAIWNGAISFYSSADQLHRNLDTDGNTANSAPKRGSVDARTPLLGFQAAKESHGRLPIHAVPIRRTATLYDPRNASPFKLSRLRVPRYRQFWSTCSLFILICLFLAVLIERSSRITSLELVFWFWSAGFMLDEVVGFNEQGFSLYIMSFWNIFDLGILLLLIVYYCMRIYGVFLIDAHHWNDMAYDVLASNAILLLPRIFSVLDHYQYFSQLLIAFRLMAVDLAAVFVLVLISCSGFFVFFTLSKNHNDASDVAYKIFQILMGFTPAAWDVWPEYNFLGRLLMVSFLIICHFLVVTILITVLTNSFMAIASNANEEHQFLFAINTISMVKNDALFSYIAPGNIIAWMLMPLRYVMSMRQFVLLNRTIIKITHFPLLFCIFFYEKWILASYLYEPTDLVENQGRIRDRVISFADPTRRTSLFSPNLRTREESVTGRQKDRALEEVFRRPPDMSTLRYQRRQARRKSQTAIRHWMDQNDDLGGEFPTLNTQHTGDSRRWSFSRDLPRRFRQFSEARSVASDPADLVSNSGYTGRAFGGRRFTRIQQDQSEYKDQTDADGDDELVTNDDDDDNATSRAEQEGDDEDYFNTPVATRFDTLAPSSLDSRTTNKRSSTNASPKAGPSRRQGLHSRTLSSNTILYAPNEPTRRTRSPSSSSDRSTARRSRPKSSRTPTGTPAPTKGFKSPPKSIYTSQHNTRPRPIPSHTAPGRPVLSDPRLLRLSSIDVDINSDGGVDHDVGNDFAAVPSSFQTQMAFATGQLKGLGRGTQDRESSDRMSRIMLARMKTLEEGFADVVREMRMTRSTVPTAQNSGDDGSSVGPTSVKGVGNDHRYPRWSKEKETDRPGSAKEQKVGMKPTKPKSKGKEVAIAKSESTTSGEPRLRRRGSSF